MASLEFRDKNDSIQLLTLLSGHEHVSYVISHPEELIAVSNTPHDHPLAMITSAKGRWVLLSHKAAAAQINGRSVARLKVLTHDDVIELAGVKLRFYAETFEKLNADSDEVHRQDRCPYTLEKFQAGDLIIRCPNCRTAHSAEAWVEMKICGHIYCTYRIQLKSDPPLTENANV